MPIVCRTHESCERAPDNTKTGKEDMWLDSGKDHIGWHFADKIRDEENQDNDRVLVGREIEVFFKTTCLCISNIRSIKKSEKV